VERRPEKWYAGDSFGQRVFVMWTATVLILNRAAALDG
jgi:hypothetical protein